MKAMKNAKAIPLLIALMMLAGCAADTAGLRIGDLRSPIYYRGERTIPLTFPKIQMALFKHQAACGEAPEFAMDPRQTNYATLTLKPAGSDSYERAVIADLVQLQGSMMEESRVKAKVYAYYADSATKQRIEQLFDAIAYPGQCGGASPEDRKEADGGETTIDQNAPSLN